MATVAVFIALGGSAYAFQLGKNSVGAKQLRKNAVTTAKVKKEAITAAKVRRGALTGAQINSSTLGVVPTAQTSNGLSPPEAWHEVGAPGEPAFYAPDHWHSSIIRVFPTVAFYKDHEGVVHLRGLAEGGIGNIIFTLPPRYRPGNQVSFVVICFGESSCATSPNVGHLTIDIDGEVLGPSGAKQFGLDGITFRAEA